LHIGGRRILDLDLENTKNFEEKKIDATNGVEFGTIRDSSLGFLGTDLFGIPFRNGERGCRCHVDVRWDYCV
jgi:hypothetical protein